MDNELNKYVGAKIRAIREEKHLTAEDLGKKIGVSRPTITRYETGLRKTNQDSLFKLADALDVSINDFFPPVEKEKSQSTTSNTLPSNTEYLYKSDSVAKHVPLIGEIACGDPITAEENVEEYITHVFPEGQVPSGELIDLRAKGHSMEPTIPDGSIVTIRLQPEVEDGEIAAVLVNGDTEATLKRIKHINGLVMLKPDNDSYDPLIITPNNPAKIIGKAIQFTSKL